MRAGILTQAQFQIPYNASWRLSTGKIPFLHVEIYYKVGIEEYRYIALGVKRKKAWLMRVSFEKTAFETELEHG